MTNSDWIEVFFVPFGDRKLGRNYFLIGSCFDSKAFFGLVVMPVFFKSDFYDLNSSSFPSVLGLIADSNPVRFFGLASFWIVELEV